jgi:hypothetical protein
MKMTSELNPIRQLLPRESWVGWESAPTRATLLVIGTDRYRLQRRLDQAQRNAKVMEPGLDFLFHDVPPLRVMLAGACSIALSYTDSSPKSYVLLARNHNELLLNGSES